MKMKKYVENLENSKNILIDAKSHFIKLFTTKNIRHNNQHEDISINVCCIHAGCISYFCRRKFLKQL
jgi:hypothetical protein